MGVESAHLPGGLRVPVRLLLTVGEERIEWTRHLRKRVQTESEPWKPSRMLPWDLPELHDRVVLDLIETRETSILFT